MQKKKHILVVSQYFYPEQFRINDICQEWVKRGYQVTVVTGIPNYPEGKFYPGYGFFKRRTEKWNGVRIIRIPLIARGKTPIGMVANYLSFVISSFLWVRFTKVKADYVFTFEVSPMTQALLGVWYSKKHKIPNYLYVQDLWPENVEIVTGIHSPFILKPIGKMVDYIYRNCDQIFATSPSFVEAICGRGISKTYVKYLPQYAEEFYKPIKKETQKDLFEKSNFKIIFTGNIGYAQGLDILPKVSEILKEKKLQIQFYIVGEGRYKAEMQKEVKKRNAEEYFHFINRQPPEKIPYLLAECDVAFLSFKNDNIFSMTIPAKLQSYLACGVPIIASADGETRRIIEESRSGICCEIGNEEKLAEGIIQMKMESDENMRRYGTNAKSYYDQNFCKEKFFAKIDSECFENE